MPSSQAPHLFFVALLLPHYCGHKNRTQPSNTSSFVRFPVSFTNNMFSKILSLSLLAFLAPQVSGACTSETVTLQQTGGSVNSISTFQSSSNVSTFYAMTGGNYGGPYSPGALDTYLFVHEDTKDCGYSLVAISGSSVSGDVTYVLPGNLTETAVQDATGTYTYDSATGKTTIKLTGTGGTKGFAASMNTGCFTLEASGMGSWKLIRPGSIAGFTQSPLNSGRDTEICLGATSTGGGNTGGGGGDPQPADPEDNCDRCRFFALFCWIRYLMNCR